MEIVGWKSSESAFCVQWRDVVRGQLTVTAKTERTHQVYKPCLARRLRREPESTSPRLRRFFRHPGRAEPVQLEMWRGDTS